MSSQPSAAPSKTWKIKGVLRGKFKSNGFDTKKAADVSGIACERIPGYPRIGLLADDETQGVQIVVLAREGELVAGDFIRLIYNTRGDEPLELDAEGVAYADGSFYVTGSHGRPRHNDIPEQRAKADAKAKASRHVFRVRFDARAVDEDGMLAGAVEITPSTKLAEFIKKDRSLGPALDEFIDKDGISVEGVAIRDGNICFGFRSPLLGSKAAMLSLPLPALFDGQEGEAKLHCVDLEKRGIRDLSVFDRGFLILAGPSQDPPGLGAVEPGDYQIFGWDGVAEHATKLTHQDLTFGNEVKPEALLPLEKRGTTLHALVFCDGPKEGGPRSIAIRMP
jgi:hypothetical protein